ncbi:hypothetical protein ACHAXH_003679 [Discostella pseudostelligera]
MNMKPSLSVVGAVVIMAAIAFCSNSVTGLSDVVAYPSSSSSSPTRRTLKRQGDHLRPQTRSSNSISLTALYYKYLHDEDDNSSIEKFDVDLLTRTRESVGISNTSTTATTRAISSRISPMIELHSISDYRNHILLNNDDASNPTSTSPLCIVRFSAPWCKLCRSTDVAWERMAAKFTSAASAAANPTTSTSAASPMKQIKFFTVNLSNNNDNGGRGEGGDHASSVGALKDMLQIDRVPQGILHHPAFGIYEQKVNLHRSNLSILKKQLERYMMEEDADIRMEDGFWNFES